MTFKYPPGQTIWASDDSELSIADAKKWVEDEAYSFDEVKMVRREGQILVVVR